MINPPDFALFVFLFPIATASLTCVVYGRLFEKSLDSYQPGPLLLAIGALLVGSFAVVMSALFSWWAYTQLV